MTACLCSCSKLKTSIFAHILFPPFCLGLTKCSSGDTQAETEWQLSKYYSGSRKLSVESIAVYKLLLEHREKDRYPDDVKVNIQLLVNARKYTVKKQSYSGLSYLLLVLGIGKARRHMPIVCYTASLLSNTIKYSDFCVCCPVSTGMKNYGLL